MIELIVNTDNADVREIVDQLESSLRGQPAARVAAESAAELTRAHLYGLASSRHRSGLGLNFYLRAADAVIAEPIADGAKVTIPHTGLALRYFGGTVRPSGRISAVTGRPIRALSVPLPGGPAEGKTPAEFSGLFVVASKRAGKAILAGRKPGGMVAALFILLKSTTHRPDPSVLPTDEQYQDAAVEALSVLLEETHGLAR